MILFNTDFPERKDTQRLGFAHLVKCPGWTDLGYAVAIWSGEQWETDDIDGDPINPYVTAFVCINQ